MNAVHWEVRSVLEMASDEADAVADVAHDLPRLVLGPDMSRHFTGHGNTCRISIPYL